MVGRAGFEPAKLKTTELQSVLVGRLSISPIKLQRILKNLEDQTILYNKISKFQKRLHTLNFKRADGGTRTHDLLITNQLL